MADGLEAQAQIVGRSAFSFSEHQIIQTDVQSLSKPNEAYAIPQEVPARTEGPTRGASFATEFDPKTGSTRQWMKSYDHAGEVIRVHPKSINGQPVDAQHYPPTGAELKSWGQQ